jgi:uncharacterized protein (DUF169 family)
MTLEQDLISALDLDRPPIAISFLAAPPEGVRRFMGQVPSSCSFWQVAATAPAGKSAFYTVPVDHEGCPVGSYTHHLDGKPGELAAVLQVFHDLSYVAPAEVPEIPRWPVAPGAIVYSRLDDAPSAPDVVLFAARPHAAMLLSEAARLAGVSASLPPLPRPTCMAIPAAASTGAVMSMGCVGNRVYTDLPESHIYLMVRGGDVRAIADSLLGKILPANRTLLGYHTDRRAQLTRS